MYYSSQVNHYDSNMRRYLYSSLKGKKLGYTTNYLKFLRTWRTTLESSSNHGCRQVEGLQGGHAGPRQRRQNYAAEHAQPGFQLRGCTYQRI